MIKNKKKILAIFTIQALIGIIFAIVIIYTRIITDYKIQVNYLRELCGIRYEKMEEYQHKLEAKESDYTFLAESYAETLQSLMQQKEQNEILKNQNKSFNMDGINCEYIGDFYCTAYCCEKYAHICGTGNGITASGAKVQAGITVAAKNSNLKYGTVLYIEDVGVRIVQDTGGGLKTNQLDVAIDTHEHALAWKGQGTHRVWILN